MRDNNSCGGKRACKTQLIAALDVSSRAQARKLIDQLAPCIKLFKVGSQLFTSQGPGIIEYIHKKGAQVFLDLKYHDIPNTVREAVICAAHLDVFMLTVHAQGGEEMLLAASGALKGLQKRPLIVAVTVLTSQPVKGVKQKVLSLARLAFACGLDGVVSSVQECAMLKESLGRNFVVVTPGIRPQGEDCGDQKRVATPKTALEAGANYIVVGRPIVKARDPLAAAKNILKELSF